MSAGMDAMNETWRAALQEGQGIWNLDIILRGDDVSDIPWMVIAVGTVVIEVLDKPRPCLICDEVKPGVPGAMTLLHAAVPEPENKIAHVICPDCTLHHGRDQIVQMAWDKWCILMPTLRRLDNHTHAAGHA